MKMLNWLFLFLISMTAYSHELSLAQRIIGRPAPPAITFGMWTYHLNGNEKFHLYQNDLLALIYRGYFAGTFVNCYNDRTYSIGVQRYWIDKKLFNCVDSNLGYRLGLLYGYDERLIDIAGKIKVLPFAQVIYDVAYKNLGFELSYTGILISASFFIRL